MVGNWLLCDFHIHTSFSDGELSLEEIVRLYGENGFDAIGISDHIADRRWLERCAVKNERPRAVQETDFSKYLQSLWRAAREAWEKYGMLLIPGTEVTNNSDGYHVLAIDIKDYVEPGMRVEDIAQAIHDQGGIAVAPHPHRGSLDGSGQLMYLWDNHERFVTVFDAWEVANRDDLFNVVGLKKFNYIANSDFHSPRHLYSWKTLLRCEKNVEAIKAAIRSNHGVAIYLFRPDKQGPIGPVG
jgi:predicted metal-dependent phosphoesterase TrpH